jgi:hypothetical protein
VKVLRPLILSRYVGFFDNTTKKFTASVDGNEAAILYVANYDYLRCKTVDDVIKAGDWVVAFHPTPGVFFNVPAAAGTYTKGSLSVANGRVKAAALMNRSAAMSKKTAHTPLRQQAISFALC